MDSDRHASNIAHTNGSGEGATQCLKMGDVAGTGIRVVLTAEQGDGMKHVKEGQKSGDDQKVKSATKNQNQ